jgi:hypothetical protein
MGQFIQTNREVVLEASGVAGDSVRIWSAPTSVPIRGLSIFVTSSGVITEAGNLEWEVFYGGRWAGTPYAEGSLHSGGVSQSSGTISGSAEVAAVVFEDFILLPANNLANVRFSTPIVLKLTNKKAKALKICVSFILETIATSF